MKNDQGNPMSYDKNCLTSRVIMCEDLQMDLSMKTSSYLGFQHFSFTRKNLLSSDLS